MCLLLYEFLKHIMRGSEENLQILRSVTKIPILWLGYQDSMAHGVIDYSLPSPHISLYLQDDIENGGICPLQLSSDGKVRIFIRQLLSYLTCLQPPPPSLPNPMSTRRETSDD